MASISYLHLIIMKKLPYFKPKAQLTGLIENYFEQALSQTKLKNKLHAPPTITGLALYLGFKSKEDFELYENRGTFGSTITRARFRIMAYYESRLHYPSPTGAIFALKTMGWDLKPKTTKTATRVKSIKVKLIETGPQPASSEKEVML
jgi:hypothetical protein